MRLFLNEYSSSTKKDLQTELLEQSAGAVNTFTLVANNLTTINDKMEQLEADKDVEIQKLLADKLALKTQREANSKVVAKINEFLS